MQDEDGQIVEPYSISAGSTTPNRTYSRQLSRSEEVEALPVNDDEAVAGQ